MNGALAAGDEFLGSKADVTSDLAQQWCSNVAALVQGNRRATAIGMAVLHMRTTLAHRHKAEPLEETAYFRGFENGERTHNQATARFCVPTNSASRWGSPSSSSIAMTSRRLVLSSSSVSACECAPLNPGTYPTSSPVTESRSTTAVNVLMPHSFTSTPVVNLCAAPLCHV